MKDFCVKLISLIVIVAILIVSYNKVYQFVRVKSDYNEDKFYDVPESIEICNFGSSHGDFGFDYSEINGDYTCFNFALMSQSLSYDYRIFQQYEEHIDSGAVVFIVLSYFSFGSDEEEENDFQLKNARYYSFLNKDRIKQFSWIEFLKNKYLAVAFQEPSSSIEEIRKGLKKEKAKTLKGSIDFNYSEDAIRKYNSHIRVDENGQLIVIEDELSALYSMIRDCQGRGGRPILVTTPFRQEYNEEFNTSFYEQYYGLIEDICRSTGVEYYDYSHDERFANSYEYFMDSDHLTKEGAVKFTNILIAEVRKNE